MGLMAHPAGVGGTQGRAKPLSFTTTTAKATIVPRARSKASIGDLISSAISVKPNWFRLFREASTTLGELVLMLG